MEIREIANLFHVENYSPQRRDNAMELSPAGKDKQKGINDKVGQSSDAITFVFLPSHAAGHSLFAA